MPIVATVVVLLAAGIMVALGVWQLQRLQWKEGLLARYNAAEQAGTEAPWPRSSDEFEGALYHHSQVDCASVGGIDEMSGRSQAGQAGWAHIAHCSLADGGTADVALGWSNSPVVPEWHGGKVSGTIGPAGKGVRLIAAPPQAGLEQLAAPDPGNIPNNHLAYAVQWFLFALTALVIYALALRKKWRSSDG